MCNNLDKSINVKFQFIFNQMQTPIAIHNIAAIEKTRDLNVAAHLPPDKREIKRIKNCWCFLD